MLTGHVTLLLSTLSYLGAKCVHDVRRMFRALSACGACHSRPLRRVMWPLVLLRFFNLCVTTVVVHLEWTSCEVMSFNNFFLFILLIHLYF